MLKHLPKLRGSLNRSNPSSVTAEPQPPPLPFLRLTIIIKDRVRMLSIYQKGIPLRLCHLCMLQRTLRPLLRPRSSLRLPAPPRQRRRPHDRRQIILISIKATNLGPPRHLRGIKATVHRTGSGCLLIRLTCTVILQHGTVVLRTLRRRTGLILLRTDTRTLPIRIIPTTDHGRRHEIRACLFIRLRVRQLWHNSNITQRRIRRSLKRIP